jgi:hypothetical protein
MLNFFKKFFKLFPFKEHQLQMIYCASCVQAELNALYLEKNSALVGFGRNMIMIINKRS